MNKQQWAALLQTNILGILIGIIMILSTFSIFTTMNPPTDELKLWTQERFSIGLGLMTLVIYHLSPIYRKINKIFILRQYEKENI